MKNLYLGLTVLGISLMACDGKKEEHKAEETKPAEATAPATTEEHKAAEPAKEEHKDTHKAS